MLLAVGSVHHHLLKSDLRAQVSIIAQTSECRDVHQLACLLGFGASAVHPYTMLSTFDDLISKNELGTVTGESRCSRIIERLSTRVC